MRTGVRGATDHLSTAGYMYSLGSAVVAWSSKKQSTVALLSTKAQYQGATITTCEAILLRLLLQDLQIGVLTPILIYCDSVSSIQLTKNPLFHARIKHIKVRYHFVHEWVLSGEVELQYVQIDRYFVNIFTKPLR